MHYKREAINGVAEDLNISLPKMYKVKQCFNKEKLEDIDVAIESEINGEQIKSKIKKGHKIALAVGSRGIKNLLKIVKSVIYEIKLLGG